jgi:hypothetical protein
MLVSQDIHRILLRVSAIIGVVCVYAGSTLKSSVPSQWGPPIVIGVIVLAMFLSSVVPDLLSWALSRWRWYRRMVMGETWVEGAWFLDTRRAGKPNEPDTTRIRIGIVAYSYVGRYLGLRTEGHHLEFTDQPLDKSGGSTLRVHDKLWYESSPILALSKIAFMDPSLTYVNVFKYDGEHSGDGTAIGWFSRGKDRRWPEEFTATIVTKSGDIFYQRGRKLEDELVRKLLKKYGADWEDVLIRHRFVNGDSWRKKLPDILP